MKKHPEIKTLVLNNIPGSINDEWNMKACHLIYTKGLETQLLENSIVESGGTDLFVSGKKLHIAKGAKIGVHSWDGAEKPAISYPKTHDENKMFLDLYRQVEIDTAFYWFTLKAAPPQEMHYMTEKEIEFYFDHKL